MGLQCYGDDRYEADDLIGTLAEYWRDRGHPICIVTADKDLAQLVRETDHWWDFSRNQKLNARQLTEKFGVTPEQMADYLALTGDPSTTFPACRASAPNRRPPCWGISVISTASMRGSKKCPHLGIRGAKSIRKKLEDHREAAHLARRLTVIETAVESALAVPDLARGEVDTARLNRLFDELAFGGMLRQRCLQV